MIVTPEAPVNAVKTAHTARHTIARPPGSQPSNACDNLTSRCGELLSLSRNPASVNNGIAISIGISDRPKNSIATIDRSISERENPSIALAAMIANNGAPSSATSNNSSAVRITSIAPRRPMRVRGNGNP